MEHGRSKNERSVAPFTFYFANGSLYLTDNDGSEGINESMFETRQLTISQKYGQVDCKHIVNAYRHVTFETNRPLAVFRTRSTTPVRCA